MKPWLRRLLDLWQVRGLLVGALCAVVDWSIVVTAIELLGLPRIASVSAGLCVGATTNFVLNRQLAFRDASGAVAGQAGRYVLVLAFEIGLHSATTALLVHGLGVHYALARLGCDFIIMNLLHLTLLRYVVFPAAKVSAAPQQL